MHKTRFARSTSILTGTGLAFLVSLAWGAGPPAVNPEQMDMGVEINAKIAKEKSRQNSQGDGMKGPTGSGGKADCGSVNINSDADKSKSNSGIKDMFGKQSTTIVTGSVINMANCK